MERKRDNLEERIKQIKNCSHADWQMSGKHPGKLSSVDLNFTVAIVCLDCGYEGTVTWEASEIWFDGITMR